MKKRVALTFCLLLAGGTDADWDHVLNYNGLEDGDATSVEASSPAAATASAPAAVAATPAAEPANADFCRSVAAQDASGNGFDQATQQRVFAQSYSQCVAIYTR
jgi:hypothetical protein